MTKSDDASHPADEARAVRLQDLDEDEPIRWPGEARRRVHLSARAQKRAVGTPGSRAAIMSATAALASVMFLALAIFVLVGAPGFRWFSGTWSDSPFVFEGQMLRAFLLCWLITAVSGAAGGIFSLLSDHGAVDRKNIALAGLLVCVLVPIAAAWLYFASLHAAVQAHFVAR